MAEDEWKPAPRFEVQFLSDGTKPGEPRRPLRPKGWVLSYSFPIPEGDCDEVNARRSRSWQFIAIDRRRSYDLKRLEAQIRQAIPEPDRHTAVLEYTEGDCTILLFSPQAVNLLRSLIQSHYGRECEKPNPGFADRLVLGPSEEWGSMIRATP
jgi:hypothetical protein